METHVVERENCISQVVFWSACHTWANTHTRTIKNETKVFVNLVDCVQWFWSTKLNSLTTQPTLSSRATFSVACSWWGMHHFLSFVLCFDYTFSMNTYSCVIIAYNIEHYNMLHMMILWEQIGISCTEICSRPFLLVHISILVLHNDKILYIFLNASPSLSNTWVLWTSNFWSTSKTKLC